MNKRDFRRWQVREGARLASYGPTRLSHGELLAHLVRDPGAARRLLEQFEELGRLTEVSVQQLAVIDGIGSDAAEQLVAAVELGKRIVQRHIEPGMKITSAEDVAAHFGPTLRDRKQEVFHVLLLDGRHHLIRSVRISEGCLTAAIVHPREVLRPAVLEAAAAILLVHNHPSGDPTPSTEDLALTRQIVAAAKLLSIDVLDHVILGGTNHISLAAMGLMSDDVTVP